MGPQQKLEDPDWVKLAAHSHIHYRVPGMERAPVRKDLTFKTTEDEPLHFDGLCSSAGVICAFSRGDSGARRANPRESADDAQGVEAA